MTKAWLLPAVVDPAETVCVQIQVPKDDRHIAAFFGAIQQLGVWSNWERDESETALATSIVWQRQLLLAAEAVRSGANCMVDCEDIEDCLETSQTIIDIDIDIDINTTNITNNETNIDLNITNITNNETNIDIVFNGGIDINIYPPCPTIAEPDELCGASFNIANQLNTLIQQIIIDALTLTLQEFLEALFGIGGFQGSFVKLWWDFIIAVGNPDLDDEVTATIDEVAEIFYCNELDLPLVKADIDASPTITEDAQAAWIGAINSITDAKYSLWAFAGAQDDSNDCSSFCPTFDWCREFDFTIDDQTWILGTSWAFGQKRGTYIPGVGFESEIKVTAGVNETSITNILRDFASTEVNKVTLEWTGAATGLWTRGFIQSAFSYTDDGVSSTNLKFYDDVDAPSTETWEGSVTMEGLAVSQWNSRCFEFETIGSRFLTKITVHGTGSNPFGADNC